MLATQCVFEIKSISLSLSRSPYMDNHFERAMGVSWLVVLSREGFFLPDFVLGYCEREGEWCGHLSGNSSVVLFTRGEREMPMRLGGLWECRLIVGRRVAYTQ